MSDAIPPDVVTHPLIGQINRGDCVAGMRAMGAATVDLAFADPPFNIGYKYDVYNDSLETDDYLRWSEDWIGEVHRVLKPSGTFWLAIGDEYAAELKVLSQRLGFACRSWVIWYYTFGVNCKYKFTRSHAHLFHFVKDLKDCTFNDLDPAVRIPSARQLVYNDSRANAKGRLPDDTWILRPQDLPHGFTADEDVWYFPRVAGTFKERAGFHGCQMPEQLLGRIIRSCSREGDVVLDPFAGSATTVTVAKKLGRRFISFEMSDEYVELGSARLARTRVGDLLDGTADPLRSVPATADGLASKKESGSKARSKKSNRAAGSPLLPFDQDDVASPTTDQKILDAFAAVYEGFSVDRVLLDPVLAPRFDHACQAAGLKQSPSDCRHLLLALRALGVLKSNGLDTTVPTIFDETQLRRWSFAAEIGWRSMLDRYPHWKLEDWLVEPHAITQYDAVAGIHAPSIDALQLRWTLVKWRRWNDVSKHRAAADSIDHASLNWQTTATDQASLKKLTTAPGFVRLVASQRPESTVLYVGETDCIAIRVADHIASDAATRHWQSQAGGQLQIQTAEMG